MAVSIDAIGNITGIYAGSDSGTDSGTNGRTGATPAPVMTGSHIDTVRTGGRYDGNYGVLAGRRWWPRCDGRAHAPTAGGDGLHQRGRRALPARHDGLRSMSAACRWPRRWPRAASTAPPWAGAGAHRLPGNGGGRRARGQLRSSCISNRAGAGAAGPAPRRGRACRASHGTSTPSGVSNHAGTTPMALRRDAGHAAARVATFVHDALRYGGGRSARSAPCSSRPT